jgi:catechol 2,3-dioxygenase-like lactoylglutathione lyase family enzyme
MPIDVSPLVHIEIVVRDVNAAVDFLERVFGAKRTEPELVSFLNEAAAGLLKVEHVELGNVVLQFIEPMEDGQDVWSEHLRKKGPGVHNLTFQVDDLNRAAAALAEAGAPTLFTMDLEWAKLFGSELARENVPPVHMIGSEEIVGFRLELAENPMKE